MLVAGRTMSNDMIDNQSSKDPVTQINPFAHFSNLREFNSLSGLSNSWNSINSKIIPIGYKSELERSNCSGGCDYSFFPIDNGNFNVRDSFVWSTGDALHFTPLPDLIYGLQGTPRNDYENAFVNSVLIDVDNDLVSYDKAMIGDVDIFKGECKGAIPSPCDKIDVTANSLSQTRGDCCWDFTVSGLIPAGTFDHITATPITPGVFFSSTSAPAGWGTNLVSNIASWSPTSGPIITDSTSGLKSCFVNTSGSAVFSVQFAFYTTQGGVCYDTVRLDCAPVQIQNDSCCAPNIVRATCINSSQNGSSYSITMSI
jgi:hypothetical protein